MCFRLLYFLVWAVPVCRVCYLFCVCSSFVVCVLFVVFCFHLVVFPSYSSMSLNIYIFQASQTPRFSLHFLIKNSISLTFLGGTTRLAQSEVRNHGGVALMLAQGGRANVIWGGVINQYLRLYPLLSTLYPNIPTHPPSPKSPPPHPYTPAFPYNPPHPIPGVPV